MKLNCGPTAHERRRAKIEKRNHYVEHIHNWHKWFAWFPVRVGKSDCRWLEYVWRKDNNWWRNHCFNNWERLGPKSPTWEYKAIE